MAFSGFQFDRGAKMLGFDFKFPQEQQNTFWCLWDVWGNYADDGRSGLLSVEKGSFALQTLHLKKTVCRVCRKGQSLAFQPLPEGGLKLAEPAVITAGEPLEITFAE
jgi:hypothetical protein